MPNPIVIRNKHAGMTGWPLHPLAGGASLWLAAVIAFGQVADTFNMPERTFHAALFVVIFVAAWLAKVVGSSEFPKAGYFAWAAVVLVPMAFRTFVAS
jgi:hypothetical protein